MHRSSGLWFSPPRPLHSLAYYQFHLPTPLVKYSRERKKNLFIIIILHDCCCYGQPKKCNKNVATGEGSIAVFGSNKVYMTSKTKGGRGLIHPLPSPLLDLALLPPVIFQCQVNYSHIDILAFINCVIIIDIGICEKVILGYYAHAKR